MSTPQPPKPPLRVLSLDGGGFRGYVSLKILDQLMRHLPPGVLPCDFFDLICGTSTGGLIAIMLGRLRMTTADAIKAYLEMGPRIFGDPKGVLAQVVQGKKFEPVELENAVRELVRKKFPDVEGDLELLDPDPNRPCYTFVTTVSGADANPSSPLLLRTYPTPIGGIDAGPNGHAWTIVEAARATSAAPFYFPSLSVARGQAGFAPSTFKDAGASGFNNPAQAALHEARRIPALKGRPLGVLVSFGTGFASLAPKGKAEPAADEREAKVAQVAETIRKRLGAPGRSVERIRELAGQLVSVATDSSRVEYEVRQQVKQLKEMSGVTEELYFRHNPDRGLGDIDLAEYGHVDAFDAIVNDYVLTREDDIERCVGRMKTLEQENPSHEADLT